MPSTARARAVMKTIAIKPVVRLKMRWASARRLPATLAPIAPRRAVTVVPTLDPMAIAKLFS